MTEEMADYVLRGKGAKQTPDVNSLNSNHSTARVSFQLAPAETRATTHRRWAEPTADLTAALQQKQQQQQRHVCAYAGMSMLTQ